MIVVVTGFSTSIGRATALEFARQGANVIATMNLSNEKDIDVKKLTDDDFKDIRGSIEISNLDLSSFKSIESFASRLQRKLFFKSLDYLVLNVYFHHSISKNILLIFPPNNLYLPRKIFFRDNLKKVLMELKFILLQIIWDYFYSQNCYTEKLNYLSAGF